MGRGDRSLGGRSFVRKLLEYIQCTEEVVGGLGGKVRLFSELPPSVTGGGDRVPGEPTLGRDDRSWSWDRSPENVRHGTRAHYVPGPVSGK